MEDSVSRTTTFVMNIPIVIPLKERRPCVIVQIIKNDLKTPDNKVAGNAKGIDKRPVMIGCALHKLWEKNIDILNSSTLVFQMKSNTPNDCYRRILNFDCVANGDADQVIRCQMSGLVDRLLINGLKNCCLLRIGPQRNAPSLHILSHIIIPEISKRLTSAEISPLLLYAIRIEYYDVRKYDVLNMIQRTSPKNKPRHHTTLRNTWELLQWVQDTYPTLWKEGAGHECLDLHFVFVRDQSDKKVRAKLSIMNLYMNKIDADMTAGLRNFLENIGMPNNARIRSSILTDYLREYFYGQDNWHNWMLFQVPSSKKGEVINEMLTMASSAHAGVQSLIDGKIKAVKSIFQESLEKDFLCPIYNGSQSPSVSRFGTYVRSSVSNSVSQIASRILNKEKQSLSYWYRQMDEKFLNVLLTMEAYYVRKNKSIMKQPSEDSKTDAKTMERRKFLNTVRNTNDTIQAPDLRLKVLALHYRQAVSSLHCLIQQIEQSHFAPILKALIQIVNNELAHHLTDVLERTNSLSKENRINKSETPRTTKGKQTSK